MYKKHYQPEKEQLCFLDVGACSSFLEGAFCALVRIFFTSLIKRTWVDSSIIKSVLGSKNVNIGTLQINSHMLK